MRAAGEASGLLLPPPALAGSYLLINRPYLPLIDASYLEPPASAISASGMYVMPGTSSTSKSSESRSSF